MARVRVARMSPELLAALPDAELATVSASFFQNLDCLLAHYSGHRASSRHHMC
jgi:hypothetical protein